MERNRRASNPQVRRVSKIPKKVQVSQCTHQIVEGLIPLVEALQDNSGEDVADEAHGGDGDEDHSLQPESARWCRCQQTAFELFDIS